jgi:hypothetical protein
MTDVPVHTRAAHPVTEPHLVRPSTPAVLYACPDEDQDPQYAMRRLAAHADQHGWTITARVLDLRPRLRLEERPGWPRVCALLAAHRGALLVTPTVSTWPAHVVPTLKHSGMTVRVTCEPDRVLASDLPAGALPEIRGLTDEQLQPALLLVHLSHPRRPRRPRPLPGVPRGTHQCSRRGEDGPQRVVVPVPRLCSSLPLRTSPLSRACPGAALPHRRDPVHRTAAGCGPRPTTAPAPPKTPALDTEGGELGRPRSGNRWTPIRKATC